jgi:uncharacterized protein YjbI with pentapeptide repeats
MRKTHDYEFAYENEGVAGSCHIRIFEDGDRPVIVATQQRAPQGAHRGSVLNAANVIAAHFIENGPLSDFHISRELHEESVQRQTLELIAEVAPFVFVEEYLEPEHKYNFLWFDSYEILGLRLGGKVQKQIGNAYRQPVSGEDVEALLSAYTFVCQCDEQFRSACEGLSLYAEYEDKPYCVLHYPGFDEKVHAFDEVVNNKLEREDHNFRGAWFPYSHSFQYHEFKSAVDFSHARFSEEPEQEWQHTSHFSGSKFRSDANFHGTVFQTGVVFSEVSFEGYSTFSEAAFEDDADFTKARFYKEANFSESTFAGEALFTDARFREGVKLDGAVFRDNAYFYDTVLHGDAKDAVLDFSKTSFHGAANFGGTRFFAKGNVVFSEGDESRDSRARFSGRADFGGATFRSDAYFAAVEFPGEADFSGTTFLKQAGFWGAAFRQDADFYDAKFLNAAHFHEATFDGKTNFTDAKFTERRNGGFFEAKFGDLVDFRDAHLGDVTFRLASFEEAWFGQTRFSSAEFRQAKFNKEADFNAAAFGDVDFSEAMFNKGANFVETTFEKRANFSETILLGRIRFFGTETNRIFGPGTLVDFQDARVQDPEQLTFHTVLLRPNWFVNMDARSITFVNVVWYGVSNKLKGSLENEIRALENRAIESHHKLLARTCRELYTNYEEKRDYPSANEFHYWSMDALRRESWKQFGPIRIAYWAMSGYGERVGRAFWVLVFVWAMFTGLYWLFGPESLRISTGFLDSADQFRRSAEHLWRAAVYSLSALARLNPYPHPESGLFQLLVTLEGLLGPLQIALFALAARRTVMR